MKQAVLRALADAGGAVEDPEGRVVPRIADRIGVDRPCVSGVIRRLRIEGFLTTVTTANRRTVNVTLTPDGWNTANRRPPRPVTLARADPPAVKEPPAPAPVFTNRLIAVTEEAPALPVLDPGAAAGDP